MNRVASIAGATFAVALALCAGSGLAVPIATPPPGPSATPTPSPIPGAILPYNSSLMFVLDGTISSTGSKPDDMVRVHLKDPLVIGGVTVAPAGSPAYIRVLRAMGSQIGDVYGYVDIYFMPLRLPDGRQLPLRAPTSHLTATTTVGHEATVATEDTIGDIFIPYHILYHMFRKGRNFVLHPGGEIRARTAATIALDRRGVVVLATPAPFKMRSDTPTAGTFSPLPFATAAPLYGPTPKPKPTPSPTPAPSPSA